MIVAMLVGFFQIRRLEFISDNRSPPGGQAKDEEDESTDAVMAITAFGTFVYATFTVIAGVLSSGGETYEPPELVITNGLLELIQVWIHA